MWCRCRWELPTGYGWIMQALCKGRGDSEAVYLLRGSVLSLSFAEPHKRDTPARPDEPDLRHVPGNGS